MLLICYKRLLCCSYFLFSGIKTIGKRETENINHCLLIISVNCIILFFIKTNHCWNILCSFKHFIWKHELFEGRTFVYTYTSANALCNMLPNSF
jgi:hypothetical protein